MGRRAVIALIALVVGTAAISGFFVWRVNENIGDPVRLIAILDGVALPASWHTVHTEANRDVLTGSRAHRSFLIDANPEDALLTVKGAVEAAGFTVVQIDCSPSDPGGSITCSVSATRDRDELIVSLMPRGSTSTYSVGSQSVEFGDANHSIAVISAHRRARDGLLP